MRARSAEDGRVAMRAHDEQCTMKIRQRPRMFACLCELSSQPNLFGLLPGDRLEACPADWRAGSLSHRRSRRRSRRWHASSRRVSRCIGRTWSRSTSGGWAGCSARRPTSPTSCSAPRKTGGSGSRWRWRPPGRRRCCWRSRRRAWRPASREPEAGPSTARGGPSQVEAAGADPIVVAPGRERDAVAPLPLGVLRQLPLGTAPGSGIARPGSIPDPRMRTRSSRCCGAGA